MGHFGTRINLTWRQSRPEWLKRNICRSLNYIEESKFESFSRIKVIIRDKWNWNNQSILQGKPLFTKYLLFSSSCGLHSFLLKSQTTTPPSLVRNDAKPHHAWLSSEFPRLCETPLCTLLNLIFLLLNCLMSIWFLIQQEGSWKGQEILEYLTPLEMFSINRSAMEKFSVSVSL